jgi:hypothetical protein
MVIIDVSAAKMDGDLAAKQWVVMNYSNLAM